MGIEHLLLILKIFIVRLIPGNPSIVKKGLVWTKRVANEKVFNKVSDIDEQREKLGLKFIGSVKDVAKLDPEAIEQNS
jgi:hypothetical protein